MTVCAVTMCRDEADIIEPVLRHLVAEGVRRIIVADNLSTDDTPNILKRLVAEGLPVTVVEDDDPAYNQDEKMTRLARQAARTGATWVLPFDADEIWFSPHGKLCDALAGLPIEVDTVAAFGFDHIGAGAASGLSPFRRKDTQPLPKVAFRARVDIQVAMGNHACNPCHQAVTGPLMYRHFQYRSLEQMTRKVRQGAEAYSHTTKDAETGAHWKRLAALTDSALQAEWDTLVDETGLVYDPAPLRPAPSVSIVIPTYDRGDLLANTVQAVEKTAPAAELIIVADGPEGSELATVRLPENQGFAAACNAGAAAATGDVVVFLNDDTMPQKGWLEPLLQHPGIAGARLVNGDGSDQHTGVFLRRDPLGRLEAYNRTTPGPRALVPAVTGACLSVPKTVFDDLGGFDKGFRNGYEDVDLCLKAWEAGVPVAYEPSSVVAHHLSQSSGRFDHAQENIARLDERWGGLEV